MLGLRADVYRGDLSPDAAGVVIGDLSSAAET
jgi:hypothetical protein